MRYGVILGIVALVGCMLSGTAMAADVSSSTLSQMGIHNMQTVSDAQGEQIRGTGFAAVTGSAVARIFFAGRTSVSTANYSALDNVGGLFNASGSDFTQVTGFARVGGALRPVVRVEALGSSAAVANF